MRKKVTICTCILILFLSGVFYIGQIAKKPENENYNLKKEVHKKFQIVLSDDQWNQYHTQYDGFKTKDEFERTGEEYIKRLKN